MTATWWLVRALVGAAVLAPLSILQSSTAHAEDTGLIDVSITTNSMPVIDLSDPTQVVELSGTITNTSTIPVKFTGVNFWRSTTPITTQTELDDALASPPGVPTGRRQPPFTVESGHAQRIKEDEWFRPGEQAKFRVRATVKELEFNTDDAAYLVGVHVRGIAESAIGRQTVGRGRILVAATSSPLLSSQVVELAAGPKRTPDGDFFDNSLATSLETELDELLVNAEKANSTVLLDPMLLMDVRALATEHTVNGVTEPPVDAAATWATRIEDLISSGRVLRLPWGNIDLPRAQAVGELKNALGWADDALTDPKVRALPLAGDLDQSANADVAMELSRLGFAMVFARNTSGGAIGSMRVMRLSEPDKEGMGPGGRSTHAQQLGQRAASEVVSDVPPTYLVRTVAEARDIGALEGHVVAPITDRGRITFTTSKDAPRWTNLTERIAASISTMAFRLDLTGNNDLPRLERIAAVAMSSCFVTEAAAMDWFSSASVAVADPDKITISAAANFVMASRSNIFPVTVTNGLEVPITIRLVFDSYSPQRIRVPSTELETIQAGDSQVIIVTPQASSNGVVSVEGHMETRGGQRFGTSISIDITSTHLGGAGWVMIIASGAAVLGGTVWRIRQVRSTDAKKNGP